MDFFISILGYLMNISYNFINNYGLAIILFTFITRVILIPISVWAHKNSIKMIKIQPEINKIKVKYYGDAENIAIHQAAIYKREKYNSFASLIPLIIQIILLIGVIQVIYNPLDFLLDIPLGAIDELINLTAQLTGADADSSSIQTTVINTIHNPIYFNEFLNIKSVSNIDEILSSIQQIDTYFLSFDLTAIPIFKKGFTLLVPFISCLSAYLMCKTQNDANVLQSQQTKLNKYGTMLFSVALSLYLSLVVPIGVALYWTSGNLLSIAQMYILNALISPKKHIDYEALRVTTEELNKLNSLGGKRKKWFEKDKYYKKEKEDYKKFFSVKNKKLVFYSEGNGFYKYFKDIIEYILEHSNITIHYICRDVNDAMFERAKHNDKIKAYYIGDRKLITLMMKLDCEVMVMTTPDIENFHIKRSYVKKDICYIFTEHGIGSTNLFYNKNALAYFDAIFCVGPYQIEELRAQEQLYNTKEKQLIETGYVLIDDMIKTFNETHINHNEKPTILIAPSWQKDNIMDSCLGDIIDNIKGDNYKIIVRPHPQYVRLYQSKINALLEKYKDDFNDDFIIETDFSNNFTVFSADVLITDWSAIGYEFSFTSLRPTVFVNTPMKVQNPEWKELGVEPVDFELRKEIGKAFDINELCDIKNIIDDMLNSHEKYKEKIIKCRDENIFNLGSSAKVAGSFILKTLVEKQNKNRLK